MTVEIDSRKYLEQMLQLRKELLWVEKDRLRGNKGYSVDEVVEMMNRAVEEAANV